MEREPEEKKRRYWMYFLLAAGALGVISGIASVVSLPSNILNYYGLDGNVTLTQVWNLSGKPSISGWGINNNTPACELQVGPAICINGSSGTKQGLYINGSPVSGSGDTITGFGISNGSTHTAEINTTLGTFTAIFDDQSGSGSADGWWPLNNSGWLLNVSNTLDFNRSKLVNVTAINGTNGSTHTITVYYSDGSSVKAIIDDAVSTYTAGVGLNLTGGSVFAVNASVCTGGNFSYWNGSFWLCNNQSVGGGSASSTPISQFNISNSSVNTTITNNTNINFTASSPLQIALSGSQFIWSALTASTSQAGFIAAIDFEKFSHAGSSNTTITCGDGILCTGTTSIVINENYTFYENKTFNNSINISGNLTVFGNTNASDLTLRNIISCTTALETNSTGAVVCGTDPAGGAGNVTSTNGTADYYALFTSSTNIVTGRLQNINQFLMAWSSVNVSDNLTVDGGTLFCDSNANNCSIASASINGNTSIGNSSYNNWPSRTYYKNFSIGSRLTSGTTSNDQNFTWNITFPANYFSTTRYDTIDCIINFTTNTTNANKRLAFKMYDATANKTVTLYQSSDASYTTSQNDIQTAYGITFGMNNTSHMMLQTFYGGVAAGDINKNNVTNESHAIDTTHAQTLFSSLQWPPNSGCAAATCHQVQLNSCFIEEKNT